MVINKEDISKIKQLLKSEDYTNHKLAIILAIDTLGMSYEEFVKEFINLDVELSDIKEYLRKDKRFVIELSDYEIIFKYPYYDTNAWYRINVSINNKIIGVNYYFTEDSIKSVINKAFMFIIEQIHRY